MHAVYTSDAFYTVIEHIEILNLELSKLLKKSASQRDLQNLVGLKAQTQIHTITHCPKIKFCI